MLSLPRLAAAAAFLCLAGAAAAQTVINSVPYTISASGHYMLGANLVTAAGNQVAIQINAPNVVLDLNGYFVSGPGGTANATSQVINVNDVSNVTIRNGTVANNLDGIYFGPGNNSINHLVENVNVTRCLLGGIRFASATASTILRGNTISQIRGYASNNTAAYGIFAFAGVRVENNFVNSVAGGTAGGNTGDGFGIRVFDGSFSIGNTISGCTYGIFGGKYANNLTSGCATPFQGGTGFGYND